MKKHKYICQDCLKEVTINTYLVGWYEAKEAKFCPQCLMAKWRANYSEQLSK